jgi:hypothetical protein
LFFLEERLRVDQCDVARGHRFDLSAMARFDCNDDNGLWRPPTFCSIHLEEKPMEWRDISRRAKKKGAEAPFPEDCRSGYLPQPSDKMRL